MMKKDDDFIYKEVKEFILDRFTFYTGIVFNKKEFHSELKVYTREMINNSIFDLVTYMFGKKQKQNVVISTPKTWRDWIKKKHMNKKWMRWIIRKFPIKYNHHHYILNEYTTFPTLELPPDFEKRTTLTFYNYTYEGVKEIEDDKDIDK